MWPWRKLNRSSANPRATRDLSPDVLRDSAKHRDLFELLELFLVRRVESELALEERRAEVKLKTAEADAQTKLKLEEIRAQRKQLRASQMAERNRVAPRDERGRIKSVHGGPASDCAVCADAGSPFLTVDQIRNHHALGHAIGSIPNNGQPATR